MSKCVAMLLFINITSSPKVSQRLRKPPKLLHESSKSQNYSHEKLCSFYNLTQMSQHELQTLYAHLDTLHLVILRSHASLQHQNLHQLVGLTMWQVPYSKACAPSRLSADFFHYIHSTNTYNCYFPLFGGATFSCWHVQQPYACHHWGEVLINNNTSAVSGTVSFSG